MDERDGELPLFDGDTYEEEFDRERLTGQLARVYSVMSDGRWRTLEEIAAETEREDGGHDSLPAISARLRDLRKRRFGSHEVGRRACGDRHHGLFEYRLVLPTDQVSCR